MGVLVLMPAPVVPAGAATTARFASRTKLVTPDLGVPSPEPESLKNVHMPDIYVAPVHPAMFEHCIAQSGKS